LVSVESHGREAHLSGERALNSVRRCVALSYAACCENVMPSYPVGSTTAASTPFSRLRL